MTLPIWIVLGTALPIFGFGLHYLRIAARSGRFDAIMMLLFVVYGVALERFGVRTTDAYVYNSLLVMIGSPPQWVPLMVGVSWACIIFLTMRLSDRLGLPLWQRPLFDGMLGVLIDLVMDPVSSASIWTPAGEAVKACLAAPPTWGGVGLWVWCVPKGYDQLWFNVPYANFVGWFFVVAVMSALLRVTRARMNPARRGLPAQLLAGVAVTVAAIAVTKVCVTGTLWIIHHGLPSVVPFALASVGPLVFVVLSFKTLRTQNSIDWSGIAFPMFVFIVEPVSYVVMRISPDGWPRQPLILAATAIVGIGVFLLPSWRNIRKPPASAATPAVT